MYLFFFSLRFYQLNFVQLVVFFFLSINKNYLINFLFKNTKDTQSEPATGLPAQAEPTSQAKPATSLPTQAKLEPDLPAQAEP